jgi:hypothetical protein
LAKVFALEEPNPIFYSWRVHPARDRLSAAVLAAAVILLAAWLTAELMELTAWGIFAVFVLVVGCNRFFFPTSYELTALGITARYPLKTIRYQWPELRRFVYDRSGGFLSPRARRSFLDEYRGISLLFPDPSQEIIQEICRRLPSEAIVRDAALARKEANSCGG